MGKVLRIKVEQSTNTQENRKNKLAPLNKAKETPMPTINCEAQSTASHHRCRWAIVLSLNQLALQTEPADTWYAQLNGNWKVGWLAYFSVFAQRQCYSIKFYICPFQFVFSPLYYFHFFPSCAASLSLCLYLYRWNSTGEVIEKLSCRSGWFVGPVHALIHPAAPPHK